MKKKRKVVIIDYHLSNLFSVKNACEHLGMEVDITSSAKKLLEADGAILPGVGAFGDAMKNLRKCGLVSAINKFVKCGRPFMGVCLGAQLLFSESEEFGKHKGLGFIEGKVKKFPNIIKGHPILIPQIGWNRIYLPQDSENAWSKTYLKDMSNGQFMYFVHSFYMDPKDPNSILAKTNYEGFEYVSAILKNNIFAVQFHPEKSSDKGLEIYRRFSENL